MWQTFVNFAKYLALALECVSGELGETWSQENSAKVEITPVAGGAIVDVTIHGYLWTTAAVGQCLEAIPAQLQE